MKNVERGEVWMVNLGLAAKVRPCLILSISAEDENDRSLVTIVPHTTSTRGSRFEVTVRAPFVHAGAFDAQNLQTVPHAKLVRRMGKLTDLSMKPLETTVRQWLGFADLHN